MSDLAVSLTVAPIQATLQVEDSTIPVTIGIPTPLALSVSPAPAGGGGGGLLPTTIAGTPTGAGMNANSWGWIRDSVTGANWLEMFDGTTLTRALAVPQTTRYIKATGDTVKDLAAWQLVVSELVPLGGGTILIDGMLKFAPGTEATLVNAHVNASFVLQGVSPGSGIDGQHSSMTAQSTINLGHTHTQFDTGGTACAAIPRFSNSVNAVGNFMVGDVVMVWSDDIIAGPGAVNPEHDPHDAPDQINAPAEVRRIIALDSAVSPNQLIFDTSVADGFTVNPHMKKIVTCQVRVRDLTFKNILVNLVSLTDSLVENCDFENCGRVAGAIGMRVQFSHHVTISGGNSRSTVPGAIQWALGLTSEVTIEDCRFTGTGHNMTTTHARASGGAPTWYWGGPRDWTFRNNVCHNTFDRANASQPIHTHPSGYGGIIEANRLHVTGFATIGSPTVEQIVNSVIVLQSRRNTVRHNWLFGESPMGQHVNLHGIMCVGSGFQTIDHNHYSRIPVAVLLQDKYGGHTIRDDQWDDVTHCGLRVYTPVDIDGAAITTVIGVIGKTHRGQPLGGGGDPRNAWISIGHQDYPIQISRCTLPKSGNEYSIRSQPLTPTLEPGGTEVLNCTLLGYGSGGETGLGDGIVDTDVGLKRVYGNTTDP